MEQYKQLIVKSALDAWNSRLESANKTFDSFTDEELHNEVSPGRNRVLYLLGHLTAVHDKMLPLLNLEPQQYPNLDEPFLNKPDRTVSDIPSTKELRANWTAINSKLAGHFSSLTPDQWFEKH